MKKIIVNADKKFVLSVPDEARITFGPWSPPTAKTERYDRTNEDRRGTLRIYKGKGTTDILACFSGVTSFRDMSLGYAEEVMKEEGSTIWKDDEQGYYRESKVQMQKALVDPDADPE